MTKHGGRREGAGRKSLEDEYGERIVTMTVRLPESQYQFVSTQGVSAAEFIRRCIDLARNHPELLRDRPAGRPPRE